MWLHDRARQEKCQLCHLSGLTCYTAGMSDAPHTGLRERKKAATREALHETALRLFAERGYRATTVADIAEAADVSERTFFRYFRSKEDVALQDVSRLLPQLEEAIQGRPPSEPPLRALLNAFLAVSESAEAPQLALLYSGPPMSWSTPPRWSGARVLTTLESAVASALLSRPGDPAEAEDARRFRVLVAARAGLAAFRSALIRFHELGGVEALPVSRFVALMRDAFGLLEDGCRDPSQQ